MSDKQRVGYVHQHVQPFPNRRSEVAQPKVMAGRGHQKENDQSKEAQLLKREVRQTGEIVIGDEKADQGISIAQCVELYNRKGTVNQTEKEGDDAQMTSVIQQRQQARIQTAQRSD